MTNLEVFNNLSKQLFDGSTKFLDDTFENIFDTWSKVKSFPFYNVVKYSKGKYGLEIGLAGYNKKDILVEVKDGILTVEGKVEDKDVVIDEAEMKDGLLKIKFGFNEPKEIEGVKIDIK